MCIVCVDWKQGKLTNAEALRALGELMSASDKKETKHYSKVYEDIMDAELPTTEPDPELDKSWYEEMHGEE